MDLTVPRQHGRISIRLVKQRDAKTLQNELLSNRSWLRPWEATSPDGAVSFDMRLGIRRLLQRVGVGRQRRPGVGLQQRGDLVDDHS